MITVDNGSSAQEEVKLAQDLGMDVIIVDHHTVSEPEPPAFAHLNPHRVHCTYPDKGLAAVGVAFMLIIHLRRLMRDDHRFSEVQQVNLSSLLDIVALGTVADVAPLVGVNRSLVRAGVKAAQQGSRVGLRALSTVCDVKLRQLSARDISYKLGPRLNAAGRIDDARCGLHLLISDQYDEAHMIASKVEQLNRERRQIQDEVQRSAMRQAEQYAQSAAIVIASPTWHHGVVGIVAARVAEAFHRPAIILGGDSDQGVARLKGSARSVPGLNLKAALDRCSTHLLTYGGHAAAAGMTLEPERLDDFRQALCRALEEDHPSLKTLPALIADAEISLEEVNQDFLDHLNVLEPLGHGNAPPLFLTRNVKARVSTMSHGRHLKLHFNLPPHLPSEAIGWGMGHLATSCQGPVDLCYQPRWDEYKGIRKIVLMLRGIRPHDPVRPTHPS